jgi:hypothetical protein
MTMRKRRRSANGARFTPNPGPREPARGRRSRIRAKASALVDLAVEASGQDRTAAEAEQFARAKRVGRDRGVVNGNDYGAGIRLEAVYGHDGTLLREADVTVADAPDPHMPKVTVRRARRTDPLMVLHRAGTIDQLQVDAGELLRTAMEESLPPMPGVARSEVHVAPFLRGTFSDRQLRACQTVRSAFLVLGDKLPVVVWILLGGTIGGYAARARMRHTTAAGLLQSGLDKLAQHFGLAPVSADR